MTARGNEAQAGPELLVLARWEETAGWLLEHSGRWPRSQRFTLTRRVQDHALEILDQLIVARYRPRERAAVLADVNLRLERLRFLLRLARKTNATSRKAFESAMRRIDEAGRMIHGWRTAIGGRR